MKRNFYKMVVTMFLSIFLFTIPAFSGDSTQLSETQIKTLKNSVKLDGNTKALMNAISNNDVNKLAFNRELYNKYNNLFNFKIDAKGITDQESSGRCWLFAGLNIMRPEIIKRYNLDSFEFSQNYLFFWDKLEKANMFLENIIKTKDRDISDRELQQILKTPLGDGGWWNAMVNIVEKYGAVPKEIMPETENSSKTSMMNKILDKMMLHGAIKIRDYNQKGKDVDELRNVKFELLKEVYRILILHLGVPPEEFTWRYENKDHKLIEKSYTPISFYKEVANIDLKEYVSIFNHPAHEYNKYYQMNFTTNLAETENMDFINLNIDQLKEFALKSVLAGEPVWFAADIGKENDRNNGILAEGIYDYNSLYNIQIELSKKDRVLYNYSVPNHAMVLVGVDTTENGQVIKWRVENSWGTDKGEKGYWAMYQDWFDGYVFNVIINKKYLSPDILELLKTKPTKLPAWDPFYSAIMD